MKDYHKIIRVKRPVHEVFVAITEQIQAWWTNDLSGSAMRVGDSFNIAFGNTRKTMNILEAIPDELVVWECAKAYIDMPALHNKAEWEGTRMIWTLEGNDLEATIEFTHKGLHKGLECYEVCESGWDEFLGSLEKYLTTGKGEPFLKSEISESSER